VLDQYEVSTDKQSGIENDPNRPDDEQYIVRLIGQVITVSLETLKIVKSLPEDFGAASGAPSPQQELREWRMSQTHYMSSSDAQKQREELEMALKVQETSPALTPRSNAGSSSSGPQKKSSRSMRKSG